MNIGQFVSKPVLRCSYQSDVPAQSRRDSHPPMYIFQYFLCILFQRVIMLWPTVVHAFNEPWFIMSLPVGKSY